MLVFHYTVTAINELREPLHDEVMTTVFRVEGDRLVPVEESFAGERAAESTSSRSSPPRGGTSGSAASGASGSSTGANWRAYLREREKALLALLQRRADAVLERESEAAKESYSTASSELQDRSREQELNQPGQGTGPRAGRGRTAQPVRGDHRGGQGRVQRDRGADGRAAAGRGPDPRTAHQGAGPAG